MTLEARDLQLLSHPFPAEAHKFVQGLPYIHEEVVNQRLDQVDPSWSFIVKSIVTRANAGEGGADVATVTVHASLIVKGVARDGVGMAVVQKTKAGNSEANEAEKSATTDALKRCARMFGIGRYLLAIPKQNGKTVVSDIAGLKTWLKKEFGDLPTMPVYHDESPAESASLDPDDYIPQSTIVPSKPAHDAWFKELKALTAPFYVGNEKDHDFSLNGLIQNGTVKRDLAADTAAVYVFMHRIAKDFGFSPDDLKEILGMSLNDFRKKKNGTLAQAWNMAVEQYKRLEQAS
jgi:hypothetical protein